jgi:predicted TIM-barrel fold metal-dependent hydrolase
MATRLGFPVFDADNHLYETTAALTKYLPERYRDAITYVDVNGRTKIAVRGVVTDYIPNPTFERVGRPGAQEDYFKYGNPEGKPYKEIIGRGIDSLQAFRSAEPRLALMDEQGVDYTMMYPTLASLIEERLRDDPDLCAAVVHALNQWMNDEWPFVYEGRIFATPIITPGVLDHALNELEWVLERGAKAVLMRPAPAWGYDGPRSFGLPEFDPYWQRIQETNTLVIIHGSDTGYGRYSEEWEAVSTGETLAFAQPRPFSAAVGNSHRDIEDAVTSLICHGTLARFPDLRICLVENGSGWVPHLLHTLDYTYRQMPQYFAEKPSITFKRNFWMHPFHEEDPRQLIELLGADHVIFGSDYPHIEGLAEPLSYADELTDLDPADLAKVMGGNMIGLLGVR